MIFSDHNRDEIAKVIGHLRTNLPAPVLYGLDHDLVSLFGVAILDGHRARARAISVPAEILAVSDDPAVAAHAIAELAAGQDDWVDTVRRAGDLAQDQPLIAIGIVYASRHGTDRTRITVTDLDGTGYLHHAGRCDRYPVVGAPSLAALDRETLAVYLSTLALAAFVADNEANIGAYLQATTGSRCG